jgi:serine/threonine-protein kinase
MPSCPSCAHWIPDDALQCPSCSSKLPDEGWRKLREAHTAQLSLNAPVQGELVDGRYVLGARLGEGGMGVVYEGRDPRLGRRVAIKFLSPKHQGDTELAARFLREARATASLDHPNVITVFASGEHGLHPFMVMRFVDGTTAAERVGVVGALPLPEVADIARQVCDGLQCIHAQGYVHRDIKPGNLMLDRNGRVTILDFGLTRARDSDHTQSGVLFGTVGFMAPEQALNPRGVDARADLYSLGATIYFLLTAKVPFHGASPLATLVAQQAAPAPTTRALRPSLPAEVDTFLAKAMAPSPEERFQSAGEMREALSTFSAPRGSDGAGDVGVPGSPSCAAGATSPQTALREAEGIGGASTIEPVPSAIGATRVERALRRRRRSAALVLVGLAAIGALLWLWQWRSAPSGAHESAAPPTALPAPVSSPIHTPSTPWPSPDLSSPAAPPPETSSASTAAARAPATVSPRPTARVRRRAAPTADEGPTEEPEEPPARGPEAPTDTSRAGPPPVPATPAVAVPAVEKGRLRVVTLERGRGTWSEISVDGEIVGHTHSVTRTLAAGNHTVRVRREGFADERRDVVVRPARVTEVRIDLRRSP